MRSLHRTALLIALCALVACSLGGCGDDDPGADLPAGVVAKVRDHAITQDALDRATVGRLALRHSAATMPSYLPADIAGCVKSIEDEPASKDASREELQQRCEQARDRQQAAALRLLIQGRWYRLNAEQRGVSIPAEQKGAAASVAAHAGVKAAYVRELVEGVQLQFVIGGRLTEGHPGGDPKKLLAGYKERLDSEYGNDTVCADDHQVPECS